MVITVGQRSGEGRYFHREGCLKTVRRKFGSAERPLRLLRRGKATRIRRTAPTFSVAAHEPDPNVVDLYAVTPKSWK